MNEDNTKEVTEHKGHHFDAFISYRHTEMDKFVAENLHKQLENFRMPKSILKKRPGQKSKIERVFRDKEELPLTSNLEDPIMQALNNSDWLIVICSPRLRESLWCKKEIETFVKLHGRERVLAVLIEGEPAESFPDELLFKIEKKTRPDGTIEEVKVPVEPLAADVRGQSKKDVLKAMKTEILRLIAAMFGLSYDDLRQRHRERRMKRIVTATVIGGAACLLFGIFCAATAFRISEQNKTIQALADEVLEQHEELKYNQALALAELSENYMEDGDRKKAVETAVTALTEYNDLSMPYTAQAQYALEGSIRAYDTGNIYRVAYQYEMPADIEELQYSGDMDTIAILDNSKNLALFDFETGEEIMLMGANESKIAANYYYAFLGTDKFVYPVENGICVYNLEKKAAESFLELDWVDGIRTSPMGKYIAVGQRGGSYLIFDGETLEELGCTPAFDGDCMSAKTYISDDGIMICTHFSKGNGVDNYTMHFVDLTTMSTISSLDLQERAVMNVAYQDGKSYIAANSYSEYYMNSNAWLIAYDVKNGNVLWEKENPGFYANKVVLSAYSEATELLFTTDLTATFYNMENGEMRLAVTVPSEVRTVNSYVNNNNFILLCADGQLIAAGSDYIGSIDLSYRFECKTVNNEKCLYTPYGIVTLARNDNKVFFYTMEKGAEVVEVEADIDYPDSIDIIGSRADEILKEYNISNQELVNSVFYSYDEKYLFINYINYDVAIYDIENEEVVKVLETVYPLKWCLGIDEYGYMYVAGFSGCYVLNENYEPVMYVEDVVNVDFERRKFYLGWNDYIYEAPIYDVEDLLKLAESYVVTEQ